MYALTAKAMRYMDEYTISKGIPSAVLMENAAGGLVNEIISRFPDKDTEFLVVVGHGNNGADGLCVARWLIHLGYVVNVYFVGERSKVSRAFTDQLRILTSMSKSFRLYGLGSRDDLKILQQRYDVIIDGIFGIGLNRRFGANFAKFIEYLNTKSGFKVAIDIPSGLNATTGGIMDAVFKADLTVTFGNYKTGMFFGDGRAVSGEVKLIDIGIIKSGYSTIEDKLFICDKKFLDDTRHLALVPREERSHKGTFGSVGIVVGPNAMMGASMLAAKAAYRCGCGLVKIFCPNKYVGYFNVAIPEAVVVPYKNDDITGAMTEFASSVDVVLIGPGLKEDSTGRILVKQLLAMEIKLVIDAGALNIIARNLKPFRKRRADCVITPHVGEMARLCDEDIKVVDKNRVGFIKKFSQHYNVSMVLKSDVSLISLLNGNDQRLFLNTLGNSGLATAGSGDVLAGTIASLVAQGNSLNNSLLYGVMIHGNAADKLDTGEDARRKMMASDIVENLF